MAVKDIIGKAVVLTANDEAGYGSEGDAIIGVVTKVEKAANLGVYPLGYEGIKDGATLKLNATTLTTLDAEATGDYVVTVGFNQMFENVPITATSSKQPSAGNVVAADGKGGVVKLATFTSTSTAASVVALNAIAVSVNTTDKLATIKIL